MNKYEFSLRKFKESAGKIYLDGLQEEILFDKEMHKGLMSRWLDINSGSGLIEKITSQIIKNNIKQSNFIFVKEFDGKNIVLSDLSSLSLFLENLFIKKEDNIIVLSDSELTKYSCKLIESQVLVKKDVKDVLSVLGKVQISNSIDSVKSVDDLLLLSDKTKSLSTKVLLTKLKEILPNEDDYVDFLFNRNKKLSISLKDLSDVEKNKVFFLAFDWINDNTNQAKGSWLSGFLGQELRVDVRSELADMMDLFDENKDIFVQYIEKTNIGLVEFYKNLVVFLKNQKTLSSILDDKLQQLFGFYDNAPLEVRSDIGFLEFIVSEINKEKDLESHVNCAFIKVPKEIMIKDEFKKIMLDNISLFVNSFSVEIYSDLFSDEGFLKELLMKIKNNKEGNYRENISEGIIERLLSSATKSILNTDEFFEFRMGNQINCRYVDDTDESRKFDKGFFRYIHDKNGDVFNKLVVNKNFEFIANNFDLEDILSKSKGVDVLKECVKYAPLLLLNKNIPIECWFVAEKESPRLNSFFANERYACRWFLMERSKKDLLVLFEHKKDLVVDVAVALYDRGLLEKKLPSKLFEDAEFVKLFMIDFLNSIEVNDLNKSGPESLKKDNGEMLFKADILFSKDVMWDVVKLTSGKFLSFVPGFLWEEEDFVKTVLGLFDNKAIKSVDFDKVPESIRELMLQSASTGISLTELMEKRILFNSLDGSNVANPLLVNSKKNKI